MLKCVWWRKASLWKARILCWKKAQSRSYIQKSMRSCWVTPKRVGHYLWMVVGRMERESMIQLVERLVISAGLVAFCIVVWFFPVKNVGVVIKHLKISVLLWILCLKSLNRAWYRQFHQKFRFWRSLTLEKFKNVFLSKLSTWLSIVSKYLKCFIYIWSIISLCNWSSFFRWVRQVGTPNVISHTSNKGRWCMRSCITWKWDVLAFYNDSNRARIIIVLNSVLVLAGAVGISGIGH